MSSVYAKFFIFFAIFRLFFVIFGAFSVFYSDFVGFLAVFLFFRSFVSQNDRVKKQFVHYSGQLMFLFL